MKMPYGKHKGAEIDRLPSGYLKWIAENWKEDTPQNKAICLAADQEYTYREKNGCHFEDLQLDGKPRHEVLCPHCGGVVHL